MSTSKATLKGYHWLELTLHCLSRGLVSRFPALLIVSDEAITEPSLHALILSTRPREPP